MRHIDWPLLVVSSLLLAMPARAATRPHYGGTLRIMMQSAPASLDSIENANAVANDPAQSSLSRLIFDTMLSLDSQGRPQPELAVAWQADPSHQRWQFTLRDGVRFHDGSPLTSDVAAAALRMSNPSWKVVPLGGSLVIECPSPCPDILAELALPGNAIAKGDGQPQGTGPFAVGNWQPGKKLTLIAQDDYWNGRAFTDSIQVDMGKNVREQMLALDLNRADVVQIAAEQAHRAAAEGRRVVRSSPVELIALVFARDRQSPEEGRLRDALALSIDRQSMKNVLLQGEGVATGGILPDWLTGYGFLFPVDADLQRARQARYEVRVSPTWTLGYDASDPLARLIAERIVLNARDAGLALQVSSAASTDLRVLRISLSSVNPSIALASAARSLGLPAPILGGHSVEDLYTAERGLLLSQRVIPLLHLPVSYGLSGSVRNWNQDNRGIWHLEDVWMGTDKP